MELKLSLCQTIWLSRVVSWRWGFWPSCLHFITILISFSTCQISCWFRNSRVQLVVLEVSCLVRDFSCFSSVPQHSCWNKTLNELWLLPATTIHLLLYNQRGWKATCFILGKSYLRGEYFCVVSFIFPGKCYLKVEHVPFCIPLYPFHISSYTVCKVTPWYKV